MNQTADGLACRLILAGILPLPLFLAGMAVAGMFAPNYDWVAQHASELSLVAGPAGAIFSVVALVWGACFIAFGLGLLRMNPRRSLGAICWILFGVAMCSNGIWPMGDPKHGLYALPIVSLIAPSMALAESEWLRSRKGMWSITAFVSITGLFYLWLNLLGLDPEGYRGLTQRVFSSCNSLWPAFVAFRLWSGK